MTRNGGAVSDQYIASVRKEGGGDKCDNPTRKLITHNPEFRQYYKDNRQKMRSIVNKAQMFADGAPQGVVYFIESIANLIHFW